MNTDGTLALPHAAAVEALLAASATPFSATSLEAWVAAFTARVQAGDRVACGFMLNEVFGTFLPTPVDDAIQPLLDAVRQAREDCRTELQRLRDDVDIEVQKAAIGHMLDEPTFNRYRTLVFATSLDATGDYHGLMARLTEVQDDVKRRRTRTERIEQLRQQSE